MKYLLFVVQQYYPEGGWDDLHGKFNRLQEAIVVGDAYILADSSCDLSYHIVNVERMRVVKRKFVHHEDGLVTGKEEGYCEKRYRYECQECGGAGVFKTTSVEDFKSETMPNGMMCTNRRFIEKTIRCSSCKGTGKNERS